MTNTTKYAVVRWLGSNPVGSGCMEAAIAQWNENKKGWFVVYNLSSDLLDSKNNYLAFKKLSIHPDHPKWRSVPLVPL